MVDGVENLLLPGKLHLGLGGVNVDIHQGQGQRHLEDTAGEAALQKLVAVGLFHRGGEKLGLDEAAVEEEELHVPGAAARERLGDEALDLHLPAPAGDRQQGRCEVPPQGGVDGGFLPPVAGGVEGGLPVPDEAERDLRPREGQVLDQGADGPGLGAVLLHELEPRGGVVEKVADPDGGALRRGGGLRLPRHAAGEGEPGSVLRSRLAADDLNMADGGDGGQGLPPEAQGADAAQVLRRPEFGGGMAEEGGGQLGGGDAAAVVRHPDELHAAAPDLHGDGAGAGVQGVLHQLLHHAGGPLHHLAGGNELRDLPGHFLNMRHGDTSLSEWNIWNIEDRGAYRIVTALRRFASTWTAMDAQSVPERS